MEKYLTGFGIWAIGAAGALMLAIQPIIGIILLGVCVYALMHWDENKGWHD